MDVSLQDQRAFLGAASLGAHLLYPGLRPEADPLDDDAPIALLTGPLTGTAGPAVGRAVFCARSPATGLWGELNIGGFLGPELRAAGYDGLWITGRSPEPVYLWLHDGTLEIRPATDLWGQRRHLRDAGADSGASRRAACPCGLYRARRGTRRNLRLHPV